MALHVLSHHGLGLGDNFFLCKVEFDPHNKADHFDNFKWSCKFQQGPFDRYIKLSLIWAWASISWHWNPLKYAQKIKREDLIIAQCV